MLRKSWDGVGWGGDDNVLWTCTHGRCYATACSLHLHTWSVLRKSWDGVGLGWGGDDNVLWTCTHGRCYASHGMGWGGVGMITFFELAHMVGATQVMGCSLNLHTWSVLRNSMFLALAHMVGATQVMGWGGVGVGWGGDGNVHWTCTHGRCYTTACSLHLHTWSVLRKSWDGVGLGWCGVGMVMFIELAQKVSCTCLRDFWPEWFWSLCEFARACWRWIVCEYMTRCPDQTAAGVFDWHDRIWIL